MAEPFTAEERRRLAAGLARGAEPECPACGSELSRRRVERPPGVSYVRRRVWVLCPGCGRTGAVDVREDPAGEDPVSGDGPP